MEGSCLNNGDWKGKAKASPSSEDVQENIPCPNEVALIFEEGKGSENKDPKGKAIAEGLSSDVHENLPQDQPDLVALPDPGSDNMAELAAANVFGQPRVAKEDALVRQADDGRPNEGPRMFRTFACQFCPKQFSSAQALGGHQNLHKLERENAKRRRMDGPMPYNGSHLGQTPFIYPGNIPFLSRFPVGLPQPSFYDTNKFTLARPPAVGYPAYSYMPGFPNIQPTTGLILGQFGQSSDMSFNNRILSAYDRLMMMEPHQGNNGNNNHANGNFNSLERVGSRQVSILEVLRTVNGNNNGSGRDFNSLGMFSGGESGSMARGSLTLNGNGGFSAAGFEAVHTSSSVGRNFLGLSPGESNMHGEFQGHINDGRDESDGTLDLLSRFGMSTGEDGETQDDCSNKETK